MNEKEKGKECSTVVGNEGWRNRGAADESAKDKIQVLCVCVSL